MNNHKAVEKTASRKYTVILTRKSEEIILEKDIAMYEVMNVTLSQEM